MISDLFQADGPQSYGLAFGDVFVDAQPQLAAAVVGWTLQNADKTNAQGFSVDFTSVEVTAEGGTIVVTPESDWASLTLRWVACSGDYLQVFPLTIGGLPSTEKYLPV